MNDRDTRFFLRRTLALVVAAGTLGGCQPPRQTQAPDPGTGHAGPPEVWVPREDAFGLPIDVTDIEVLVPRDAAR
jgi:hypothetical protein